MRTSTTMGGSLMHIPYLIAAFLQGLGLDAAQVQMLWNNCLPAQRRQHLCHQVARLLARRPQSKGAVAATCRFLEDLNPHDLVQATESAVLDGRVSRAAVVGLQKRLLNEMNAAGHWK
jgi:hypothetical protein